MIRKLRRHKFLVMAKEAGEMGERLGAMEGSGVLRGLVQPSRADGGG